MCDMTFEKAQAQLAAEQQRIPQTIEFTVQDDFVKSLPQILSNINEIRVWVAERTKLDREMVLVTDEDFDQAKKRCAELNKIRDAIKSKKTDVKNAYMQPYTVFEKAINETVEVLETAKDNLWSQVKEAEEKIRADKLDKLKTYWKETLNQEITQYRKFEDIANPKWLNKGTKFSVAFGEMDKQCQQIENDLTAIQSLNSGEFEIPLLEYYKSGHNLGDTIAYHSRLQSQKTARETAKAETQANTQNAYEQSGQAQQTAQIDENEEIYELTFKVEGTKAQLNALKAFMQEKGIKFGRA